MSLFLSNNRCSYTPDSADSCGSTPLMDALRAGHIQVAEILVKEHEVCFQQLLMFPLTVPSLLMLLGGGRVWGWGGKQLRPSKTES